MSDATPNAVGGGDQSLFRRLLDGRVPHVLGGYVAALAGVVWRHGQPGRNHWTRVERVGVPANVVVAGAVLFFGFAGTTLGSVTTTVTVEDEEGNAIEREVPKTEFRRRTAAALDSAEAIGSGFAAPFDGLRSIGDMDLASALEDTARLAAAIEAAEALIATGGVEAFRPIVQAQRGRLAELRARIEGG